MGTIMSKARVSQLWPPELKEAVLRVAGQRGMTDFTIAAVLNHLPQEEQKKFKSFIDAPTVTDDDEAAAFYESEENRKVHGVARKRTSDTEQPEQPDDQAENEVEAKTTDPFADLRSRFGIKYASELTDDDLDF
jgi:hypothetical protein